MMKMITFLLKLHIRKNIQLSTLLNFQKILPVKWMSIEALEEGRFTLASDM